MQFTVDQNGKTQFAPYVHTVDIKRPVFIFKDKNKKDLIRFNYAVQTNESNNVEKTKYNLDIVLYLPMNLIVDEKSLKEIRNKICSIKLEISLNNRKDFDAYFIESSKFNFSTKEKFKDNILNYLKDVRSEIRYDSIHATNGNFLTVYSNKNWQVSYIINDGKKGKRKELRQKGSTIEREIQKYIQDNIDMTSISDKKFNQLQNINTRIINQKLITQIKRKKRQSFSRRNELRLARMKLAIKELIG